MRRHLVAIMRHMWVRHMGTVLVGIERGRCQWTEHSRHGKIRYLARILRVEWGNGWRYERGEDHLLGDLVARGVQQVMV